MPVRKFRISFVQLHHALPRPTSIEQNIQSIKVCTTTRAAEPMPKPKYTPIYLPTCGLCPSLPLTSAQLLSQTLPPVKDQHLKQAVDAILDRFMHDGTKQALKLRSTHRSVKFVRRLT